MSEAVLKSLSIKDLLTIYKKQIDNPNNKVASFYREQYSNRSGGSYTNHK